MTFPVPGDYRDIDPAKLLERVERVPPYNIELEERIYRESVFELRRIYGRCMRQGSYFKEYNLHEAEVPTRYLERVRARMIEGNPALERHLCIEKNTVSYYIQPVCSRRSWLSWLWRK